MTFFLPTASTFDWAEEVDANIALSFHYSNLGNQSLNLTELSLHEDVAVDGNCLTEHGKNMVPTANNSLEEDAKNGNAVDVADLGHEGVAVDGSCPMDHSKNTLPDKSFQEDAKHGNAVVVADQVHDGVAVGGNCPTEHGKNMVPDNSFPEDGKNGNAVGVADQDHEGVPVEQVNEKKWFRLNFNAEDTSPGPENISGGSTELTDMPNLSSTKGTFGTRHYWVKSILVFLKLLK